MNFEEMLPKDLKNFIVGLNKLLEEKENSKSIISKVIDNERDDVCCPKCKGKNIVKDGLYKGRQKFKCKDCNKKFNSLTNTPFHHSRLTYNQIENAYQCLVDKLPIRKVAFKLKISTKTAFILRHKIISCLNFVREKVILSGEMELDEYYLSINLKGTKQEDMPRLSKKRTTKGTGTRGISKHKICVISGVDEKDNMYFKIAGTGPVSSDMIKDTILPKISNSKKIVTDCKSSYESVAQDNKWNLKQIKSCGYSDRDGNSLANINSLHSQLTNFLSNFHGVSTKHLQQYLDWFVFSKIQNYQVDYINQPDDYQSKTITRNTDVKYSNVYNNYSNLKFDDIYSDYNFHPSKCTT